MPIITCSGKRKAKVALELIDKSYCSKKNLWYYSVKLNALNLFNKGTLPYPQQIVITKASENDLNVFKECWSEMKDKIFFGDKIYNDSTFFEDLFKKNNSIMLTPIKRVKAKIEDLKKEIIPMKACFQRQYRLLDNQ